MLVHDALDQNPCGQLAYFVLGLRYRRQRWIAEGRQGNVIVAHDREIGRNPHAGFRGRANAADRHQIVAEKHG